MLNTVIEKTKFDEKELKIIREEEFQKLYKALDYMKNHEVVVDTLNGFMTYKAYQEFAYSLSNNVKGDILLNLKDIDDRAEVISFKLDEIFNIDIDDNSEWSDRTINEQYECEKIVITLFNNSRLMLEYQW